MHFTTYAKDEFAIYTSQTKFQMMSCMLKLNATVWQQKLNTEDKERVGLMTTPHIAPYDKGRCGHLYDKRR